jgi:crotonobetainyl-CoA:carnitine CoA-transferase CaiB-like acyl-CoA transferase
LFERERSGHGQFVGVSLLRSALTMQSARMIWAEGEALDIWRDMRSGGITGLHPTREGYLYLSANTPHFWQALCEKTGLAELANDPRYDTVRKRAQHAAEIVPKLRAALLTRTATQWEQLFGDQVPCARARRIEDMFDHPQVLAEEIVTAIEHPTLGSYRGVARADQVRAHAGAGAIRCAGTGTRYCRGRAGHDAATSLANQLLDGRDR